MRDVQEREGVILGVALEAETGDIGVVGLMIAGERKLTQALQSVVAEAIDSGEAGVLKAHKIVVVDRHTLIALFGNTLEFR